MRSNAAMVFSIANILRFLGALGGFYRPY